MIFDDQKYIFERSTRIDDFVGKTFDKIVETDDSLIFKYGNHLFKMYHSQNCCESVDLIDVCGDYDDILNSPIVMATETLSDENPKDDYDESFTWTFYNIYSMKGCITMRWYGSSNGYYSERVDIEQFIKK
jgi:hypothetical protein